MILCFYNILEFFKDIDVQLGLEEIDTQGLAAWMHKRAPTKNKAKYLQEVRTICIWVNF